MSDDYSGEEKQGGTSSRPSKFYREGKAFYLYNFSKPQKVLLEGMIVSYMGRLRET